MDWEVGGSKPRIDTLVFFSWVFFSDRTFTQGLKITGEKLLDNFVQVGELIAQKAAPWC